VLHSFNGRFPGQSGKADTRISKLLDFSASSDDGADGGGGRPRTFKYVQINCKYLQIKLQSDHMRQLIFSYTPDAFLYDGQVWIKMKKRSEIRKHCALAVVRRSQKYSPHRRPPSPRARDGQNLISWRWSLPLTTNPVWWGSMHAISSYRGNRPPHTQTHRQDRLQYTAPQLASAPCIARHKTTL